MMSRSVLRAKGDKMVVKKPVSTARINESAAKALAKNAMSKEHTSLSSTQTGPNTKRQRPSEAVQKATKKLKADSAISSPPSQKLDIYVFGDGDSGELGLGSKPINGKGPINARYPLHNTLLDANTVGVVQIDAGGMHCVSLTHDQKIVTWGVNDNGALGRDTTWEAPTRDIDQDSNSEDSDDESGLSPTESTPTAIPKEDFGKGVRTFVQVAATDSASFALTSDGVVYGWGTFCANDGILGFFTDDAIQAAKAKDAKKKFQRKPAQIPHLTKIVSLAAGNNHVLALDNRGKAYAWGAGEQSQLGRRIVERTRFSSLSACRLRLSKIKQIACGAHHSFAINEDGLVYAWGLNNFGQTGIMHKAGEGDAAIHEPTIVENLKPYKIREIRGGEHHSIACTEDGKVLVWGRCDEGQAGIKFDNLSKDDILFDSRGMPRIILKPAVIPGLHAVSVAAAIDNSIAITTDGKAYAWGYSENYRTGLGTEKTAIEATLLQKGDSKDKKLSFARCGGQFSILAGPAVDYLL